MSYYSTFLLIIKFHVTGLHSINIFAHPRVLVIGLTNFIINEDDDMRYEINQIFRISNIATAGFSCKEKPIEIVNFTHISRSSHKKG